MKKILKSKKALSPVVAAIILIAVTVAVSIAVAAWMGALTFTFMKTEEIRVTGHTWSGTTSVALTLKNTGTGKLTISQIQVNGAANSSSPGWTGTNVLDPGDSSTITVLGSGYTGGFTAGTKYEFSFVTATGNVFKYIATAPS